MLGLQTSRQVRCRKQGEGSQSDDGDEEPRAPNTGGKKKFPPQIKTVTVINATHIPKLERMHTLRDVDLMEPVAPQYKLWSITFDCTDRPVNTNRGNSAALVLDPIIDGFRLT